MPNPSQHLEFKTILAGVRTPRVAVLLNEADEDWQLTIRRVIEWASQCWGGRHFILIPTYGSKIHPYFWAILKEYDPDYIFKYHRTARDWEIGRPEKFRQLVDRQVDAWVQQHNSTNREEVREMLEPQIRDLYLDNFDASPDLSKALKRRLAPCHYEDRVVQRAIGATSTPHYPLCGYLPLASKLEPPQVTELTLPVQDDLLELYSGAVTGLFSPPLDRAFSDRNIPKVDVHVLNSDVWLAELLLDGRIDFRDSQLEVQMPTGIRINYDFVGEVPFSWSMLNLSYFRLRGFQDWTAPIFIVVGNTRCKAKLPSPSQSIAGFASGSS